MITPTAAQRKIRDTPAPDLLVVAPAGCGKTEALALRIQGLIDRGDVASPQKVLVTTFSNRARDNIRERLSDYVPASVLRDRVTVANFHGLAARLFRAHANVLDLDPGMAIPDRDWVGDQARSMKLDYNASVALQRVLSEVKREFLSDAEVEAVLQAPGYEKALAVERLRIRENRLTYDDLPRFAELILAHNEVAELYRAHFGAVIVDEFQDLTPQQLRIVNRIGYKRTTYAGDLAQGIYGFAGAKPAQVDAAIRAECTEVIEFSESHRSSPAVLAMVNAMSPLTLGSTLTSAVPDSWPGGGAAAVKSHATVQAEGIWVMKVARAILERAPRHRVGIISRTLGRRRFVEAALTDENIPYFRWDDGILDTDTARIVKAMLAGLDMRQFQEAVDKISFLRDRVSYESVAEPSARESLQGALEWCHDLLREGVMPRDIRSRVKVGDASTLVTMPGIHLLTGHVGKGQQFDWVIVVGLEEGILPDFRADGDEQLIEEARVLSVMMSRARHGVVLTSCDVVPTNGGWEKPRAPSRFLEQVASANPVNGDELAQWFLRANWKKISER